MRACACACVYARLCVRACVTVSVGSIREWGGGGNFMFRFSTLSSLAGCVRDGVSELLGSR